MWRNNKGILSGGTQSQGDGDGNGAVNDLDFTLWRDNYGNVRGTAGAGSGSLSAAGVPEPASAALIFFGAVSFATHRLRRAA